MPEHPPDFPDFPSLPEYAFVVNGALLNALFATCNREMFLSKLDENTLDRFRHQVEGLPGQTLVFGWTEEIAKARLVRRTCPEGEPEDIPSLIDEFFLWADDQPAFVDEDMNEAFWDRVEQAFEEFLEIRRNRSQAAR